MKFRILVIRSITHGVVTNLEASKPELMEYLNNMLKADCNHSEDIYPLKEDGKQQVSIIPVLQSPEAWDYMKTQINMSPNYNKVYIDKINALVLRQKDSIFSLSKSGSVKLGVMVFVFPAEYKLNEKFISSQVLDQLEGILVSNQDKHDIDEISFGLVEEIEEEPENILYN